MRASPPPHFIDAGVSDAGAADAGASDGGACPACTSTSPLTYTLPSPAGITVWTTTTMDKVLLDTAIPTLMLPTLDVLAAKNELEPFQIVLQAPGRAQLTLAMTPFTGPGMINMIEIRRVGYVAATPSDPASISNTQIPESLAPTTFGTTESLVGGQNQPFWITVQVPKTAVAGDYTSTLTVMSGSTSQNITVNLHVFNFAIPDAIYFDGDWELPYPDSSNLQNVEDFKNFVFAHRVVPSTVAYPAGLGVEDYDCPTQSFLWDPGQPYDIGTLGPMYIDGTGWNGIGFPSFESGVGGNVRQDPLCGVSLGADPRGTPAYNVQWASFMAKLDARLVTQGWAEQELLLHVRRATESERLRPRCVSGRASEGGGSAQMRIAITEQGPRAGDRREPARQRQQL